MILPVNSIIKRKDALNGGLIGGFFRFAVGGEVYGTTCRHVIADTNQSRAGDILTDENNTPIGTLTHWLKLLDDKKINSAEFALFKPIEGCIPAWVKNDSSFKPAGFANATLNATVDFVSAQGTRHGTVTDLQHKVAITFNNAEYYFICIEVQSMPGEKFSLPGHSGGAVYRGDSLLGIILGISTDGNKTYIIPFANGILRFVNLKIF